MGFVGYNKVRDEKMTEIISKLQLNLKNLLDVRYPDLNKKLIKADKINGKFQGVMVNVGEPFNVDYGPVCGFIKDKWFTPIYLKHRLIIGYNSANRCANDYKQFEMLMIPLLEECISKINQFLPKSKWYIGNSIVFVDGFKALENSAGYEFSVVCDCAPYEFKVE